MSLHATLPAHEDETAGVVSTLVTAFADDPFIRWMFLGPERYLAAFPLVLKYFAGAAFKTQTAYKSECGSACNFDPHLGVIGVQK